MKILITTDVFKPVVNGVVTSVLTLYDQLKKQGHDVRILTLSNNRRSRKEKDVYYIGALPAFLYPNARMTVRIYHPYLEELIQWQPEIIHTQTEFSTYFFARRIAKKLNIPIVHTYHTMYEDYAHYFIKSRKLGRICVAAYSRILLSKTQAVVTPTQKVQNVLKRYGVKKEMFRIPTGIQLNRFTKQLPDSERLGLRRALNISENDSILLSVGRLGKEKNIQELIGFMVKLTKCDKNVKLLIVGDGPYRKELENEVKELGLEECVIFTGMVPQDKVPDYYHLGDIFVNASRSETQGLTYIEAMASGLPLLCRRDECLINVIDQGNNGFMYETEDEFIKYVLSMIDDPAFRKRLRQNAVDKSMEYTAENFSAAIERTYKRVCCEFCPGQMDRTGA
ncbi:MAG TPA: glycosyltransferase family 4 protein [Clostridia bacterium]|nr:glycosyltransferase family 4 protein [Clostridia bacterium]